LAIVAAAIFQIIAASSYLPQPLAQGILVLFLQKKTMRRIFIPRAYLY